MIHFKSSLVHFFSLVAFLPVLVEGHGYLKSPRSRNWVAQEDGTNSRGPQGEGIPEQDFCPHCLNSKLANNLCSQGNAATLYDKWRDINGLPMPWTSQGVYKEGDEFSVEAVLTTNHAGHMDMYICPDGDDSSQECLWDNPVTMVRDELYGGPNDPNYPERAYFSNDQSQFKYTYKLPEGVCGEKVLVQWRYITANSCFPPGYKNTAVGERLQELGWLRASGMRDCQYPYDPTGATGAGKPEQFWNCAEITINCANPTVSPAPTKPPQPTLQPRPTPSPTASPAAPTEGYCNYGGTHDTSRETCDGQVEGGDWCNENKGQCEGSCNGNWCSIAPPPTPVTWAPTAKPVTKAPVKAPTSPPVQCSEDPAEEFFLRFKNGDINDPVYKDCEWLSAKDSDKIERLCTKRTDSNNGVGPPKDSCPVTCGTCPTGSPTDRPSKRPTAPPVKSPTKSPTGTPPTSSPVGGDACCSQFFDVCKPNPWCQESVSNCVTCNGVFLTGLPKQCIPRFGMCGGNEEGCCPPATCVAGNGGVGQCMYSP